MQYKKGPAAFFRIRLASGPEVSGSALLFAIFDEIEYNSYICIVASMLDPLRSLAAD